MPYISIESGRLTVEQKRRLIERDSHSLRDNPYSRAVLYGYNQGVAG